mmetsp:Transcript_36953/g.50933  ORF Transcript_36953/g.50933 Transcript_36953/m.50933 type:complete len:498 (+) Transcript_36953:1285-2778(+)
MRRRVGRMRRRMGRMRRVVRQVVRQEGVVGRIMRRVMRGMGGMGGMGGSNPFAGMNIFTPDTVNKIKADPALAPFLDDPSFVEKLNSVIANPANMEKYMKDEPRLMQVFVALMKDSLKGMGIGDPTAKAEPPKAEPKVEPKAEPKAEPPKAEPKAEPPKAEPEAPKHSEPEPMDIDIDKQKAEAAKALGNAAYSKKDFEKAIEHYSEAINYNKTNIVYYLNRAAVYLTKGDYEKCEAECDLAVEIGRTYKCDFTQIGKAFHRKGKALIKQKKYTEACAVLQKSLSEKRSADVLKDYQLAEKLKKKQDMEDYFDTDKSLEAKSRGNEFFQKHQFPDAVKEYTEAIKRNPKDAALYSNRAAAYTKLMAYTEALKDCDKCVEIDPKFIKGYSRRATVHFMMKDYHKAISAYENAMKIDPNHPDVIKGYSQTLQKIQETRGDKDRTDRALHDPEIQELLREDQVQSLLQLLKNDPAAAQRAIQTNPELNRKFRVLMNAGLV